ncbi:DUF2790 domain-containing protein [Pseudomonas sp. CCI3.2]|uniref:DUF2790 domain-containing protein n=1 Tax=unclassified Pseudomonas TaxID=196821 RepID=UPI002AC95D9E|nr:MULTISPECIES: DUF2790 domain-containing protein [unclassified Pseudomonas]MEB0076072.1 DUF2790 domain-containing protein [Pseudomonas sp. MH10out]MEB0090822.1 DUF2790 domain-containing protein [Pseudomonas sp. CCI4.2]MEB0100127.1 DUF2790 domain-containing protein [Pseudomonas sp. CCI3.2]MEB0156174.1 DUF2790 domain-containing protein [Pseudomonas sp. AH2 (2023)]MEB0166265.1 DUF2790 domain-containing protein [Pseudomonas sp. CCC4.4]
MSIRNALITLALAGLSISAMAEDAATAKSDQTAPVDIYTYDSHPDIAKVISHTEPGTPAVQKPCN